MLRYWIILAWTWSSDILVRIVLLHVFSSIISATLPRSFPSTVLPYPSALATTRTHSPSYGSTYYRKLTTQKRLLFEIVVSVISKSWFALTSDSWWSFALGNALILIKSIFWATGSDDNLRWKIRHDINAEIILQKSMNPAWGRDNLPLKHMFTYLDGCWSSHYLADDTTCTRKPKKNQVDSTVPFRGTTWSTFP